MIQLPPSVAFNMIQFGIRFGGLDFALTRPMNKKRYSGSMYSLVLPVVVTLTICWPLASVAAPIKFSELPASCEFLVGNSSLPAAIQDELYGSPAYLTGKYDQLEALFATAGVPDVHAQNLRAILGMAESEQIADAALLQVAGFLKSADFKKSVHICVFEQSCVEDNAAAQHLRANSQGNVRFRDFDSAYRGDPYLSELEALRDKMEYDKAGQPKTILLKPFRKSPSEDDQDDSVDILAQIGTFEGEVLHELIHAADTEIIKTWVAANHKLKMNGQPTDALFETFTRPTGIPGVYEVSDNFYTLFSEARAYNAVISIYKLFAPNLTEEQERFVFEQVAFSVWMATIRGAGQFGSTVANSDRDKLLRMSGLPDLTLENLTNPSVRIQISRSIKSILSGKTSWIGIMVGSLSRANKISPQR